MTGYPHVLKVADEVSWIGAIDHDIVTFDVVMETKFGTTYNSYLIKAEKIAIIETVKEKFWDNFLEKLQSEIDPSKIDYIVLNHTEPDHSGAVANLLGLAPHAKIVGTGNAIRYLSDMVPFSFESIQVRDGQELSLGNKTLRFVSAPNLHWPDSMYTYLVEDQILFTCDSFGAHYADERMFDDLVGDWDESFRYYFDVILKPFSKFMLKAIERIKPLSIKVICTGHGPILRTKWSELVELSENLAFEALHEPKTKRVFIPYVSAYDNTTKLAIAIAQGIESVGPIQAVPMNIEHSSLGELESELSMCSALIVGSPTINQNILLPVYKLFALVNPLRDKGKLAGGFGSYGWSGEGMKLIRTNLESLKLNYTETDVFVKFKPDETDLQRAVNYGQSFGRLLLSNEVD